MSNIDASIKECFVWVGNAVSWEIIVRRALCETEMVERESLSSLLTNVFLGKNSSDHRIWNLDSAGQFLQGRSTER